MYNVKKVTKTIATKEYISYKKKTKIVVVLSRSVECATRCIYGMCIQQYIRERERERQADRHRERDERIKRKEKRKELEQLQHA